MILDLRWDTQTLAVHLVDTARTDQDANEEHDEDRHVFGPVSVRRSVVMCLMVLESSAEG